MSSLFSNPVSPAREATSSLPRRPGSLSKSPLRALYDLLIGPMEGVSQNTALRLLAWTVRYVGGIYTHGARLPLP